MRKVIVIADQNLDRKKKKDLSQTQRKMQNFDPVSSTCSHQRIQHSSRKKGPKIAKKYAVPISTGGNGYRKKKKKKYKYKAVKLTSECRLLEK
jgi:hypothetical protein